MSFSLIVLAILSVIGGGLALPPFWGSNYIGKFATTVNAKFYESHAEYHSAVLISVVAAAADATIGIVAAVMLYGRRKSILEGMMNTGVGRFLHTVSSNKFYVDELYQIVIVTPFAVLSHVLWAVIDRLLIDGIMVGGTAHTTRFVAEQFRRMQSGFIPAYLLTFSCGALALLLILMTLLRQ